MKRGECVHGVFAKGCSRCRPAAPNATALVPQHPACGDLHPHAAHQGFATICPLHDMTSNGTEPCRCGAPPWCLGVP